MEDKVFIDRKEEMGSLLSALKRKGHELIIVYGRRRVGKSRLLREISKQAKVGLFVMLEEADYATNLKKVSSEAMVNFGFPSFSPSTFRELFKAIPDGTSIFLDEYSYIAGSAGEFQAIWEEIAKPKGLKIVLSGSLIRIMEDLNYSLKSPLYGRATKIIKLMPLSIPYVREWYGKNAKFEDVLNTYFCVGGIPRYMEIMQEPGQAGIKDAFFSKEGLLLREGKLFIKESFPSSLLIPKIMLSIANGSTESTKIANSVRLKGSEIGKYLSMLSEYGFVEKKYPVLGGGKKDVRFYPGDRLFSFWNRFIWPYYNEIEAGTSRQALSDFEANFAAFCGQEFEKVIIELIMIYPDILPVDFTIIGRQWGRIPPRLKPEVGKESYEIDICAANEKTKEIAFCECKWKDNVDAVKIIEELREKSKFVKWHEGNRKEHYCVIAKSFARKTNEPDVILFDLKGMAEKIGWQ